MQKRCFVITPLGQVDSPERRHADKVWEDVLRPVFEPAGYRLVRSDKMTDPGQITQAIFQQIRDSEVCIADLSFLNANVMYELGVRHCLRMPTIQIKSEATRNPFDTQNQRTIDFDVESDQSLAALAAEIKSQLGWIEQNPGAVSNPLTLALGPDLENTAQQRLERALADVIRKVAQIDEIVARKLGESFESEIVSQSDGNPDNANEAREVIERELDVDTIDWQPQHDGSVRGQFAGFEIALRPQSKNRWSSSAVNESNGYSVTYPSWKASREEARRAILQNMLSEIEYGSR